MTDRFAGSECTRERHKGRRLGTLWYNELHVEGDVTLSPLFEEFDPLMRLDVLRDLIGFLQQEYDDAHAKMWPKKNVKKMR